MPFSLPGAWQRRALALVPATLILLIGSLAYERSRTVIGDVAEVEQSHEVIELSDAVLTRAVDAETGQRAFLLSRENAFLEPYQGARRDIERDLQNLRRLAAGDSVEESELRVLERLIKERFVLLDQPIAERRAGAAGPWTSRLMAGKLKMDELRGAVAQLQHRARARLAERHDEEHQSLRSAAVVIAVAAIAGLFLSFLVNLAFSRAVADTETANEELRRVNEDLERQSEQLEMQATEMESQAAELEATAEDLRATNEELNRTTRAAEEARDAAEQARLQLESVLENLPDSAALFDSQWHWLYMNPSSKRTVASLGYDSSSMIGKELWETMPSLKGTRIESEMRRAGREHKLVEYEEYLREPDIWTENSIVPVGDAVLTITRDITRRKREQIGAQLLSDASQVLSSTLDYEKTLQAVARLAVGELADWCGVELVDQEGQIHQVVVAHVDPSKVQWAKELNKRYPPDYLAPTGVGNVIRTGEPELYAEIPEELLVAGAQDEEHLRLMRELQMRSALIVPMTARGRTLGALSLVSSEKGRRYDQKDVELAMELATRAAIAIDNAQLYRSALAASDAKSAFLATMSHELRTPLNAIIGYQALLSEAIAGPLNDAQKGQLSRIRASADHLLGLIDEVLTFSRVEAGKEIVQREETSLRPIIEQVVTMVTPLAEAKDLRVRSDGEDALMFTDPIKVRQILLNILSNAIKFTDTGEIVVSARKTGERVMIAIKDTGIGVAPENQEKIFDPFWQVEQRSTRKVGGTGLGLSVSRSLARLLGGEVTVESTLEQGSTFILSLPLRRN